MIPGTGSARISFQNGASLPLGADTRKYFSYVPQGNTVMSGTIADNLRLVREDASDEELVSALKTACAWDFVSRLPDGINSLVGERGHGLSEGQCQRIAIARAILRDAPVLLMDEATSALDPISTSKIEDLAIELKSKYTVVMVTHNMQQAARISDNTAFFLLGELVEMGRTEKLFAYPQDKRTEDYITGRFG